MVGREREEVGREDVGYRGGAPECSRSFPSGDGPIVRLALAKRTAADRASPHDQGRGRNRSSAGSSSRRGKSVRRGTESDASWCEGGRGGGQSRICRAAGGS